MKSKCSTCTFLNPSDGYCRKEGGYVNILQKDDCSLYIVQEPAKDAPAAATKKCQDCGRELPLSDFGFHKSGHRKNICRECQGKRTYASRRDAKAAEETKKATDVTMTDAEMVAALRGNGWTVTCTRTITEEL